MVRQAPGGNSSICLGEEPSPQKKVHYQLIRLRIEFSLSEQEILRFFMTFVHRLGV